MSSKFDIEKFRAKPRTVQRKPRARDLNTDLYKPGPGELFLKGPVPLAWLAKAAHVRGKALHVAIILWFRSGLEKKYELGLNQSRWQTFGLTRDSARRGLAVLERLGLVVVTRHPGRRPIVKMILNDRTLGRCSKASKHACTQGGSHETD